jgi:hypothetical protein
MKQDQTADSQQTFGTWDDAERLRRWAFLQRTPQQRLDWLVQALELAYQSGALKSQPVSKT